MYRISRAKHRRRLYSPAMSLGPPGMPAVHEIKAIR